MTDHDGLDLSVLDPMQDPEHWRRVMVATLLRVDEALSRRAGDPLATIAGWTRPLLVAAAIALVLLVPAKLALESREAEVEQVRRLVSLSVEWDPVERSPSGAEFLRALTSEGTP